MEESVCDETADEITVLKPINNNVKNVQIAALRAPSFEGYFASGSKNRFAYNREGEKLNLTLENKLREIEDHLNHIQSLLREIDSLRMVVRLESRKPQKKRFMAVVESDVFHSLIIGIDWENEGTPTIGLVSPISSSTECILDGDGGLLVSPLSRQQKLFKPVSVQTLWSAKQIIDRAVHYATKNNYFEGTPTNGFVEHYEASLSSAQRCIVEWNEIPDSSTNVSYDKVNGEDDDPEEKEVKNMLRKVLREVMRKVDLDEVTCKQVFIMCEEATGLHLKPHKQFINEEMLVVMGQMDEASQILDYLYLGSEWNASDLTGLKELGIGYIVNITKEVDNFFPKTFNYYNIRVYDEENTELLRYWDHTYRFIEEARQSGSKVLVHCRYGISRSASTVIAYLMKKNGWGMIESLDFVKGIRTIVEPNQGFQKQLIIYEGILHSSRNRFSRLFKTPQQDENVDYDNSEKLLKGKRNRLSELHKQHSDLEISEFIIENSPSSDEVIDAVVDTETAVTETSSNVEIAEVLVTDENGHCTNMVENGNGETCDEEQTRMYTNGSSNGEVTTPLDDTNGGVRKKLIRAKTMTSGAVLIEEEGVETTRPKSQIDRSPSLEIRDADEDRLLQQVVKATEMKTQLIGSIKNDLPTVTAHNDIDDGSECCEMVDMIKPSVLRRVSEP